ncbi:MAG: nucleotidyltransferase family protein [Nanoarchaeota archaeon]
MTKINLDEIRNKALPILRKAGVTRSSLFGSLVRGENREDSDIDMLVDFPRGKGLFEFAGLQFQLEDALKKKVDLVEYESLHPLLKERILAEQVQIL